MVKIKEERERSTIDIGTRIYHSERVEVSRVVETSLDYTEDVYWNGANVRDSQSLPARRCDDHYDHGRCQQPCVTMRQARKLLDRFAISIRSEIEIS